MCDDNRITITYRDCEIIIGRGGFVSGWAAILDLAPGLHALWGELGSTPLHDHYVESSSDRPHIRDVLLFMVALHSGRAITRVSQTTVRKAHIISLMWSVLKIV